MFEKKKYIKLINLQELKDNYTIADFRIFVRGYTNSIKTYPNTDTPMLFLEPDVEIIISRYDGSFETIYCTKLMKSYKINSILINGVKVR